MEELSIGVVHALAFNAIYALPARRCLLFCDDAAGVLQQSNTYNFTEDMHLTLVDGQLEISGGFIRNVWKNPVNVILKV